MTQVPIAPRDIQLAEALRPVLALIRELYPGEDPAAVLWGAVGSQLLFGAAKADMLNATADAMVRTLRDLQVQVSAAVVPEA